MESPPVVLLHKKDTKVVREQYLFFLWREISLCQPWKVIRRGTRKSVIRNIGKDSIMSCVSQCRYASQPIMRSCIST